MIVVVSAIVDPWVTTLSFVVALAMRIQGSINSKDLKNIEIALPNVEDIIEFEDKVVPIDNLIKLNEIENRNLSQLRDMLLSKLMSVKIHVGY